MDKETSMKNKLKEELSEIHPKYRVRHIKKSPEINNICTEMFPGAELAVIVYCLFHGGDPYCTVCGSPVKFQGKKTCSTKCRAISQKDHMQNIVAKRKATCIEKYGVDNPLRNSSIQEKRLSTLYEKYGRYASPTTISLARERASNLNIKGKITLKEKYGVSNPSQIDGIQEKIKQTCVSKFGAENYQNSDVFLNLCKSKRYKKWESIFPKNIKIIDICKNSNKEKVFVKSNFELHVHCSICNNSESIPTETAKWRMRNTGTPCMTCGNISQGSLKQQRLYEFISSFGVNTIQNFKLANNKEIDVYCSDYNIGFEFNGLYWHNDLRKDKEYHIEKTNTALEQGIFLVQIFEDEWDHKKEIVKSKITHILGFTEYKLYARKCIVKQITDSDEKEFLDINHLQGYALSSLSLGLYYNDQLVSIMSFNISLQQNNHWELVNYCSKLNHLIVGGASKLFSYFINHYNAESVITYVDKRWSSGNMFSLMGFDKNKDIGIDYWYIDIKHGKRIERCTNIQTIDENSYRLKIWDCGFHNFIWTKKAA